MQRWGAAHHACPSAKLLAIIETLPAEMAIISRLKLL